MAEHIQAKTLNIDGMYLGRMVTRQGDVAYHFLLKDDSEVFQEGTVYRFFKPPWIHIISSVFFESRKYVTFHVIESG